MSKDLGPHPRPLPSQGAGQAQPAQPDPNPNPVNQPQQAQNLTQAAQQGAGFGPQSGSPPRGAVNIPAKGNREVVKAAKESGVDEGKINAVQAQINAIDLNPIADLFDWNGGFFTWALRSIDLIQSTLWVMQMLDPENAAKLAALLQRVEDFINDRRAQSNP